MSRARLMLAALATLAACGGNTGPTTGGPDVAACQGIEADTALDATISYEFLADDIQVAGGLTIDADDNGHLQAHLSRVTSAGASTATWFGTLLPGSVAAVNELQTNGTDSSTYTSSGEVIPTAPGTTGIELDVDMQHCSYSLRAVASVIAFLTDATGTVTSTETPVIQIQLVDTVRADFATAGLSRGSAILPAHSTNWIASHPDADALFPLGIVGPLFDGTADEAGAGQADAEFQVTVSP